jgi:hypothetical protein
MVALAVCLSFLFITNLFTQSSFLSELSSGCRLY